MYESIYKNDELENEVSLDMSYFWYSDVWICQLTCQLPNLMYKFAYFTAVLFIIFT